MANAQAAPITGSRYWIVPIARAVLALIPAAIITFNRDHSATFGLAVFGSFALASGLLLAVLSWRTQLDSRDRSLFMVQSAVGVIAGALALAFQGGGLGFFLYLVSVWGAVTGFLELYSGARVRGRAAPARDWMLVGAFTALLALIFLLLPPHAVVSVGLLGVYLVMLGVYLVIAGLSLKWARTDTTRTDATRTDATRTDAPATNDSDTL